MIAQILNTITGEVGQFDSLVTSPYYAEEVQGLQRVKVLKLIPSSSGLASFGWDYWAPSEVTYFPGAQALYGSQVEFVTRKGRILAGEVLSVSTKKNDVLVLMADGSCGWVSIERITAITSVKLFHAKFA